MEKDIKLIESLRYDASQKSLSRLAMHFARLSNSAAILFERQLNLSRLQHTLEQTLSPLQQGLYKIRITLDPQDDIEISASPLSPPKEQIHISISDIAINSQRILQRHKSNQRNVYNSERDKALQQGFHDVLFFNEHDQLAEASIHNVFILEDGVYYTPPIHCGALPGVMRQWLLENKPKQYKERTITRAALCQSEQIILTNSVAEIVHANFPPPASAETTRALIL